MLETTDVESQIASPNELELDFAAIPEAPKSDGSQSLMKIGETVALITPWALRRLLEGRTICASDALEEIPEFRKRGVRRCNGIGDAMGFRGLKLWKMNRSGPKIFGPCFENVGLLWRRLTPDQGNQLADELGFESAAELVAKIRQLPRHLDLQD